MPLIIVALGILALLFLIMGLKLNTFISLLVVSFGVALALGMPFDKVVSSIEAGIGGTLGHIALIFGLGAMLGKLIADSGGAQRIAMTLVNKFGEKNIQWAVVIASFIIGISLFFEVGLVLLIPIVFAISRELKISILFLGIPMVAALSVTHGFLPPHRDILRSPVSMAQTLEKCCCMALLLLFRQCSSQGRYLQSSRKKSFLHHLRKTAILHHSAHKKRLTLKKHPALESVSLLQCSRLSSCRSRPLSTCFKKQSGLQITEF